MVTRDPALSFRLLSATNAAATGLPRKVVLGARGGHAAGHRPGPPVGLADGAGRHVRRRRGVPGQRRQPGPDVPGGRRADGRLRGLRVHRRAAARRRRAARRPDRRAGREAAAGAGPGRRAHATAPASWVGCWRRAGLRAAGAAGRRLAGADGCSSRTRTWPRPAGPPRPSRACSARTGGTWPPPDSPVDPPAPARLTAWQTAVRVTWWGHSTTGSRTPGSGC